MDRMQDSSPALTPCVDAIDRIGVSAVARSLGISKQAVRKWRRHDSIPNDRQGDIRRLLETLPEQDSAIARVTEVSDLDSRVPPVQLSANGLLEGHGDCGSTQTSREAHNIDHRLVARLQKYVLR